MNILVCLKIVSQATFTDSLTDNDDRLSGGRLGINPADAYALELALRIKDNAPETMVTVVTMAPSYAENALRAHICRSRPPGAYCAFGSGYQRTCCCGREHIAIRFF